MSSCMHCSHWKSPPWESNEKIGDQTGQCTFNPVWLDTHSMHFCGRFVAGSPGLMGEWWESMGQRNAELDLYRRRARKAEAAAKEMRRKLKAKD